MDAFYASIEQLDDPSLRGKALIVGGRSPRAVVTTASYEARPFGVRSAMPMMDALRRCPHAIVVPPRMSRYAEVSRAIMAILRRFTPLVEPLSLDEAFVDVTHSTQLFGSGESIAKTIRAAIRDELGLTASAGVATSKFVAKIASDLRKPDGLTVVVAGREAEFLAPLAVSRMWGVGPKATEKLARASIKTIGDLARRTPSDLARILGSSWGEYIVELARGIDPREVVPEREAVSIGAENTFERDLRGIAELEPEILAQASRVAARLVEAGLTCRVVTLKIKLSDHTLITRRTTLDAAAADTVTIHRAALAQLARVELGGAGVRLTGVSLSGLVPEQKEQRPLFPDAAQSRRRLLEKTLGDVRAKFGDDAVRPAGAGGGHFLSRDRSSAKELLRDSGEDAGSRSPQAGNPVTKRR